MNKLYPRPHDRQTVYLKDVITKPNIEVGDYTIYNDFVHDPHDFERNSVAIPASQASQFSPQQPVS